LNIYFPFMEEITGRESLLLGFTSEPDSLLSCFFCGTLHPTKTKERIKSIMKFFM
jgi:hypothetical protein